MGTAPFSLPPGCTQNPDGTISCPDMEFTQLYNAVGPNNWLELPRDAARLAQTLGNRNANPNAKTYVLLLTES